MRRGPRLRILLGMYGKAGYAGQDKSKKTGNKTTHQKKGHSAPR